MMAQPNKFADAGSGYILNPGLSDMEVALFIAFQETCHEIVQKEGQKLDLIADAFPIAVSLSFRMFPDLDDVDRKALIFNVVKATADGALLFRESMGEA